ncbi:MAG: AAA family ATPase [Pirellulales bacterium]|nr:AAA family ATPase [Pirellulales bacterium]
MNINSLEIHGFGIWKNLHAERLSPGLTVFYGPNEAGKSTIMQFLRGMLYGFTPGRRAKYLPPVQGGRAGGELSLLHDRVNWTLRRWDEQQSGLGELSLIGADQRTYGEDALFGLLGEVDENTYNNVYALSLQELQELATLQETDAGRLLYEISAGLERVSLGDVLRELQTSRARLLNDGERPAQLTELLSQRDRLRSEMDQLAGEWRNRRRLQDERTELEKNISAAQQEQKILQDELRVAETAYSLRDLWSARAKLNEQLLNLGAIENIPSDAVERMDQARATLRRAAQRRQKLQKRQAQLRQRYAGYALNQNLWKQAPRILALAEHEPWLAALDQQARDAKQQSAQLEKKLSALKHQLNVANELTPVAQETQVRKLSGVLAVAKSLRQSALRLKDVRQSVLNTSGTRDDTQLEIDELLAARGESSLTAALEKTGQLAALYRRRLHLDERLAQMERNRADLEFDLREYDELQMIPTWASVGLGAVFAFGALMIMGGLFLTASYTGDRNFLMILIGAAATLVSMLFKSQLEHASARKADACQKQLGLVRRQIEQATAEIAELDGQIPEGTGPLAARLESAEYELARLEELVPLESRRVSSHQESINIRERLKQARLGYHKARKRWVAALVAAKLPETWSPRQVRELARQYQDLGHIHKQWEHTQADQDRRLREATALQTRVEQLFVETGLVPEQQSLLDNIRQLRRELNAHETQSAERKNLRQQLLKNRSRLKSLARVIHKNELQRDQLLRAVHATDERDFRERVEKYLQLADLTKRRDNYAREIHAAIQGFCGEDDLLRWFKSGSRDSLEVRLPELRQRLDTLQERLRQLFERRGALAQQLKSLAEDRRHASKQLELNIVEEKIREGVARWRALTVTQTVLDNLKAEYERERQPETLREASRYLRRLTLGQYERVWTPIGEQRLCVDDQAGQTIPVENLSRGTREQLFLALRLALTAGFSKQGRNLPLVLDDVLVNFDDVRAPAAAEVLRDFAAEGHQILLFTCHEHIGRIFKLLDVDVRRLPTHEQPDIWPEFVLADPETKIVEVIREVPKIIEVPRAEPVAVEVENRDSQPEPEVPAEPYPPAQPEPRRRRRRARGEELAPDARFVEPVDLPIVPLPIVELPIVAQPPAPPVETIRAAIDLPRHFPQPKPQKAYIPEPVVIYREAVRPAPALPARELPATPERTQVLQVFEQVFVPRVKLPVSAANVPQPPVYSVNYAERQPRPPRVELAGAASAPLPRPAVRQPQVAAVESQLRVDPPQSPRATWVAKRVNWNAEEFEGELDDQVRRERALRQALERTDVTAREAQPATMNSNADTLPGWQLVSNGTMEKIAVERVS